MTFVKREIKKITNFFLLDKTITSHHEYRTLSLPITLSSLGGTSGYVYFEFPEADFQTGATHLKFLIGSNRGKVAERTLSLGRPLD